MPAQLRIAHFVQRYPPALGGSEAYFARLSRYLAARGHRRHRLHDDGPRPGGVPWPRPLPAARHRRWKTASRCAAFRSLRLPAQRWLLKAGVAAAGARSWQALTLPWNPLSPAMWRAANGSEPLRRGPCHGVPLRLAAGLCPAAGAAARRTAAADAVSAYRRPGRSARPHAPHVHASRACWISPVPPTAFSCRPRASGRRSIRLAFRASRLDSPGPGRRSGRMHRRRPARRRGRRGASVPKTWSSAIWRT